MVCVAGGFALLVTSWFALLVGLRYLLVCVASWLAFLATPDAYDAFAGSSAYEKHLLVLICLFFFRRGRRNATEFANAELVSLCGPPQYIKNMKYIKV